MPSTPGLGVQGHELGQPRARWGLGLTQELGQRRIDSLESLRASEGGERWSARVRGRLEAERA